MHEHLQHFFDEHANPTHCSSRDVHDMALPILTMATTIQQQLVVYRQRLLAARLVDHDGELDGKMDPLKQKLKALEVLASQFIEVGEQLAEGFRKWDEILAEDQALIDAWSARKKGGPVASSPTPEPVV